MTACPRAEVAGVQKAPRHEVAGSRHCPATITMEIARPPLSRCRRDDSSRRHACLHAREPSSGSKGGNRHRRTLLTTFAFRHECCTRGDLMFSARVVSNSCAWQKIAHPATIARLIGRSCSVAWRESISCEQEIPTAHSSNWFALSSRQFVIALRGGVDGSCHWGAGPQMISLFLIMRCAPTMLVDRVDLAIPLLLFSRQATGPSALAPAQRAGAQRLRALAQGCPIQPPHMGPLTEVDLPCRRSEWHGSF